MPVWQDKKQKSSKMGIACNPGAPRELEQVCLREARMQSTWQGHMLLCAHSDTFCTICTKPAELSRMNAQHMSSK
jgi:hypothetical protein